MPGRENLSSAPSPNASDDFCSEDWSTWELLRRMPPLPPASYMAASPPTAAMEPDAACEIFEIEVKVPEDPESGPAKTIAEFKPWTEDVRKPARISAVISAAEKGLGEILRAIGFVRR